MALCFFKCLRLRQSCAKLLPGVRRIHGNIGVDPPDEDHPEKPWEKPYGYEPYSCSEPHDPPTFTDLWRYPQPDIPNRETYKPAKLLAVWRIQTLVGRPYQEKIIMINLKLNGNRNVPIIVANTPSNNHLLWKVKSLIRVRPITFPYGEPKEGDYAGAYLNTHGELIISKKLEVEPHQIEMDKEHERRRLSVEYLRHHELMKWEGKWE